MASGPLLAFSHSPSDQTKTCRAKKNPLHHAKLVLHASERSLGMIGAGVVRVSNDRQHIQYRRDSDRERADHFVSCSALGNSEA
jgi:hypothetical protein